MTPEQHGVRRLTQFTPARESTPKENPTSFLLLTITIQPEIIDCKISGNPFG